MMGSRRLEGQVWDSNHAPCQTSHFMADTESIFQTLDLVIMPTVVIISYHGTAEGSVSITVLVYYLYYYYWCTTTTVVVY